MNFPLFLESYKRTVARLPGIKAGWATLPPELQAHFATELSVLLSKRKRAQADVDHLSGDLNSAAGVLGLDLLLTQYSGWLSEEFGIDLPFYLGATQVGGFGIGAGPSAGPGPSINWAA